MAKSVKKIIKDGVFVPAIFSDVLDEVLDPALQKLVESTETPLDDVLKTAIYPALSKELKRLSVELWDKLLKEEVVQPVPGPA